MFRFISLTKLCSASSLARVPHYFTLRESSFNMTREGDEDIEGGLRKFLDTRKGRFGKIRGAPKN